MLLIGVNRSPYTRRVAITLEAYRVPYEQQALSGFGNRAEVVRRWSTAAPSSTISTRPMAAIARSRRRRAPTGAPC